MKPRVITEVGLVLIALYALLTAVVTLGTYVSMMWPCIWSSGTIREGVRSALSAITPGVLYALSAWGILVYRGSIARALFPDEVADEAPAAPSPVTWEPRGYRLGFCLVGFLVLAGNLPATVWRLAEILDLVRSNQSRLASPGLGTIANTSTAVNIIAQAVQVAFAVYLALGAPHLRRWLLKRMAGEDESTATQDGGAPPSANS